MRKASALLLLTAFVLAGLTGWSIYTIATRVAPPPAAAAGPAAAPSVEVVVAAADIPVRSVITAKQLERRSLPADAVPPAAIRSMSEALGQTTLVPISKGLPIVTTTLVAAEGRTGASLTVDPGKVLVAFPTSDPLTTAGLVAVGDHIDILATIAVGKGEDIKKTQTTLQDLEVVEVLRPTKDQPGRVQALTLEVDHQVALVLKYLRDAQATIDIVVRSTVEHALTKTTTVDTTYLVDTYGITR
ncbi:MAG: Flp pilus assembly protein CpaB [Chloroflexota bacterium]|nr:Flp pilus assembly protein CpaB [Chloroflexota bacterium]MDE3101126.1 Flp pilus assembly protein CpaB [Chloroflexota bacterium]